MPTFYLSDTDITPTTWDTLATSAPSARDITQGWTVGKNASKWCEFQPDTIFARNAAAWSVAEPAVHSTYGFRTSATISKSFAAGNWTLYFRVLSNTYYAQIGSLLMTLWRDTNGDASAATQIGIGWAVSADVTWSAADQDQDATVSVSPGAVTLSNEYLFLTLEWHATNSSGGNFGAVYFVTNEGAAERLVTPDELAATYEGKTYRNVRMRNVRLRGGS